MVASGDSNREKLDLLGDKVLGHVWLPGEDKFVFCVTVNLTPAKLNKRSQDEVSDLPTEDIPRLMNMTLTNSGLLHQLAHL